MPGSVQCRNSSGKRYSGISGLIYPPLGPQPPYPSLHPPFSVQHFPMLDFGSRPRRISNEGKVGHGDKSPLTGCNRSETSAHEEKHVDGELELGLQLQLTITTYPLPCLTLSLTARSR